MKKIRCNENQSVTAAKLIIFHLKVMGKERRLTVALLDFHVATEDVKTKHAFILTFARVIAMLISVIPMLCGLTATII